MGDSLSVIFATMVAAILMFMFPMMDTWERQDDLSYIIAYTAVVNTVDAVRNTGRLTADMYEDLVSTLNSTGNRFDVRLEHRQFTVVGDDAGNPHVVYVNHYTSEILEHLYPSNPADPSDYREFRVGDYFYISVKNRNMTQATVLKQNIYGAAMETFKIGVPYGGQVRSEYYDNEL